jgi:hypothetical protein
MTREQPRYRYLISFRCDNGANGMDVVAIVITSDTELHTTADLAPTIRSLQDNNGYTNVRIIAFEPYPDPSGQP